MIIHNRPSKDFHIIPNQNPLTDTKLNLKERGLLSAILEFATIPRWQINLSHLAAECDCSVATIQKIIRSLIKKGWLSRERIYSPQGVQGSFCRYEINLDPAAANQVSSKNSKRKIVSEYFDAKISKPVVQSQESSQHNKTNPNNTDPNNTDPNNTLSNKNVINLKREIKSKIDKLIWRNLEECEDFQNQFLIHKAKMMNKLPGEIEGIFRAMENRIQSGNPSMSDLNAIKEWRRGFFEETNFIPKSDTQAGFNKFAQESGYDSQDISDFLKAADRVNDGNSESLSKDCTEPRQKYCLSEPTISLIISDAINSGDIICERFNSDGIRGVQIDNFTFEELECWLQKQSKEA